MHRDQTIFGPVNDFTPMESKKIFVNPSYQVVAHIVLNIALVILYGIFFGQQSVRKYLDKAVIITKQKDTSSSVISPSEKYNAIAIYRVADLS